MIMSHVVFGIQVSYRRDSIGSLRLERGCVPVRFLGHRLDHVEESSVGSMADVRLSPESFRDWWRRGDLERNKHGLHPSTFVEIIWLDRSQRVLQLTLTRGASAGLCLL